MLDILLPRVVDPNSRAHGTSYTNQVYDVKTCGHRIFNESKRWSCGYGVPCPKKTPVQFMEDAVPGLWHQRLGGGTAPSKAIRQGITKPR